MNQTGQGTSHVTSWLDDSEIFERNEFRAWVLWEVIDHEARAANSGVDRT